MSAIVLPQPQHTHMYREAAETADVVSDQIDSNVDLLRSVAERISTFGPKFAVTCARGSSDHAATYAKYLIEMYLGLPTCSAAPSMSSVYQRKQRYEGALYIAISQSGKSPDLLTSVNRAKEAGALTLALVNVTDSPLAELAELVVPLRAGNELSVAATKSYIASLSAVIHLVAQASGDKGLQSLLSILPSALSRAWGLDWSYAVDTLETTDNLFILGRGLGLGIAQEAALKLKETCGLHAEAFSAAEVRHGPMAIVGRKFPLLVMSQQDETQAGIKALVQEFRARGTRVLVADGGIGEDQLPVVANSHPVIGPLLSIQSFYRMTNTLAIARGFHPDQPLHLSKVTETV